MTRTTAHLISHTHWDREWYMPYERHHVLLAKLMNELLETLEKDERYRYFHLDGQTIIIEDYLQIHPEKREQLERFILEGRIVIGPWYVLQDEFLTSSEANVRNLLIGHQDAAKYGVISKLGYFPDSFGNMGQAPQLLRQADIETAVFGRGVKPTGFDNMVGELNSSSYESPYSEMFWESPDGSSVLGLLFANWYSNGNEVPVDAGEAKAFWDKKIADAGKYASTPELLFMNGCDHQPVQRDLADALETARKLYPDTDFVHSSFEQYLEALGPSLPEDLVTVHGELRSQHTDGWGTLVNTASARVYLKQLNHQGQTLLEKGAEPLAALAYLLSGQAYPHALLTYAWKTLMQNHPHDSICGCSVDEVHREMVTRFEKSRHVGEAIMEESLKAISGQIGTMGVAAWGESAIPVTVFNTTGWERSGTVSVEVAVAKRYFKGGPNPAAIAEALDQLPLELARGRLLGADGRVLACKAEDLGTRFGYELPDDQFRKPYMARMVRLTFEAVQIPPLGYTTYAWVESPGSASAGAAGAAASPLRLTETGMENGFLAIQIREDGSYDVKDKHTGKVFAGLGVYENYGDIGNEYVFRQPEGDAALTTKGLDARITLAEHEPYRVTYEIVHEWTVPASADASFEEEKRRMVPFRQRKAGRSSAQVPLRIVTRISLEANGTGIQVSATFNNQAKDHRLRVLFPTDLAASTLLADSIFEAAERAIEPAADWINPSNAQHQQAYVSVSDGSAGLVVANKGLNEYEVLRDGSNTIAVTLLRSVSELGDWGVFPTPEAQCLGEQTAQFAVRPYAGDAGWPEAFAWAYQYQVPWFTVQTGWQQGSLPAEYQPLEWQGRTMALSAFKLSEEHEDIILRWYNLAHQEQDFALVPHFPVEAVHASDILERRKQTAILDEGILRSTAGKAQIVTYALQTVQP
ncbi:alpha-mannosidase [Paenibacillus sp. FSL R5-0912]|uniref:alpha-mannosidase n=1 Tax=Paenibacillus sp. FSL R5-0912 TaxID=1536771 RepID=UPI0004F68093|nr:alpha-mannosidase [Paenibacillus sp. FSL R5-0912]AIQ43767.1 alpha-mannosidase [Paenibacillus sp. FSL R5-0912]